MAFVCVNGDSTETMFGKKPERHENIYSDFWIDADTEYDYNYCNLPKGTIFKLIGRELSWEDEPVELTEE